MATKAMLEQATHGLAGYQRWLPAGTDVTRHWSGKTSLYEAVKSIRGDVAYATLYRHTSSIAHGADFGGQFQEDPATGELIWELEPTVNGFEAPSYAARELLWLAASRIDERLGLGFAAALAPHRLTQTDVKRAAR